MNRFYLLIIWLVVGVAGTVQAQQDIQFSQYMYNLTYYNPAYAGIEGVAKVSAFHRNQWLGYSPTTGGGVAPTTQMIVMNAPIFRINSGIGLHVSHDQLGPMSNLEAQVAYAYHLGLGNSKLSFGLRAGAFSQVFDFNQYVVVNPDEPVLREGRESQIRPDLAMGVFLRAEKYFAGVSFTHLLRSEFDFGSDQLRNALENHMYIVGGYDYEVNYNFVLTPSVLVKTDFATYSFDLSVVGTYNDKIWGGLSFRQSDAIAALFGYSFLDDNALRVGYAFDYIVTGQDAKMATSHELMLSYTLPMASGAGKKIIRTPRFRH